MRNMKTEKTSRFIIGVLIFYLLLPLVMTFLYSLFREWITILPSGFTLDAYATILADPLFWKDMFRTILISILPICICTVFVLLAMYVVVVYHPKLDRVMQVLCTIPYAIQGVVLPICILTLYSNAPSPFNNRIVMLVSAYCIVVLPYIYQGIRNNLQGIHAKRLLEAAQMLGASKFYAFFHIIVPNILGGIRVSAMLAMAIVFGDFVIINTLAGNYFPTAQMYLYDVMKKSGQRTSAVIVMLFLMTLCISASIFLGKQKGYKRKELRR